jgi:hypothetical protein
MGLIRGGQGGEAEVVFVQVCIFCVRGVHMGWMEHRIGTHCTQRIVFYYALNFLLNAVEFFT